MAGRFGAVCNFTIAFCLPKMWSLYIYYQSIKQSKAKQKTKQNPSKKNKTKQKKTKTHKQTKKHSKTRTKANKQTQTKTQQTN